jgi:hypothetical protein
MKNLREYAKEALEVAKRDLRRDKYLIPVAFIVSEEEVLDFSLQFENAEEKLSVYSEIVRAANERGARAIITVNDANLGDPTTNAITECIYLSVSGPGMQTWSIAVPYKRDDDHIDFGTASETVGDMLNLLPGWPPDQSSIH